MHTSLVHPRSCKGGSKLVSDAVWADAGDFVSDVSTYFFLVITPSAGVSSQRVEETRFTPSGWGLFNLRIHFFFTSGNIELRVTVDGNTRGDLVPIESIYAIWMDSDTVHLVLSCPTIARRLKDGRWSEVSEQSLFPSNNPVIQVEVAENCVGVVRASVHTVRHMHPKIAAFKTRADPKATDEEREHANALISELVAYCEKY